MTATRVFDGEFMPAASFLALDRQSIAFGLFPEAAGDAADYMIELMALEHDPAEPTRVWWHQTEVGRESWVSLTPGEYRTSPPEQPCIIKDVIPGIPQRLSRELLANALEGAARLPIQSAREAAILARARRLLEPRENDAAAERLRAELATARGVRSHSEYQELFERLCADYLEELVIPLSDISIALVVLQLQAASNCWIQQPWYERPRDFLAGYVDLLLREPARAGVVFELCEREFDAGRARVRQALAGSMQAMSHRLMFACHHYFGAFALLKAASEFGKTSSSLNPTVVEEAVACTNAGLKIGAGFFFGGSEDEALYRLRDGDISPAALRRKSNDSASEVWPIFTRYFSDIVSAQALTLSADSADISAGIQKLEELSIAAPASDDAFEEHWIELSLLRAHGALGNEAEKQRYAFRIAARMVLRATPCVYD
jgi:hypothetical protein